MKIIYLGLSSFGGSLVEFRRGRIRNCFVSKDGSSATSIELNINDPEWRMSYCHEVGHLLTAHRFRVGVASELAAYIGTKKERWHLFRWEVAAWRVAKSFCKGRYWNEYQALRCLKIYAEAYRIKIDWSKFQLIELNKGLEGGGVKCFI